MMINILFCGNDKVFDGMMTTMLSIFERTKTKERSLLLVINTKNLPIGVTKDSIRLTSDYGIVDIPFKVTVK